MLVTTILASVDNCFNAITLIDLIIWQDTQPLTIVVQLSECWKIFVRNSWDGLVHQWWVFKTLNWPFFSFKVWGLMLLKPTLVIPYCTPWLDGFLSRFFTWGVFLRELKYTAYPALRSSLISFGPWVEILLPGPWGFQLRLLQNPNVESILQYVYAPIYNTEGQPIWMRFSFLRLANGQLGKLVRIDPETCPIATNPLTYIHYDKCILCGLPSTMASIIGIYLGMFGMILSSRRPF